MSARQSFRTLHAEGLPLVMPAAHDALSARLIEKAGFRALATSGSAMLAVRYGLPDLGIAGLADMAAVTSDVLAATTLPCLGDGDDGYGDLKSVVRTVQVNERLGVGALVLEDQSRATKQPGQSPAEGVVSEAEIAAKIRVAVETRDSSDFWIVGRTDAYGALGLDAALRRGQLFLQQGADGLFLAGVRKPEELARIGREFHGIPLTVVMYGGEGWPWLDISELHALGFTQIVYPLAMILPICALMSDVLEDLKAAADAGRAPQPLREEQRARAALQQGVNAEFWEGVVKRRASA